MWRMTADKGAIQGAPAKINLSLHVTGQRADGYHLLESLVLFTEVGDVVHAAPADTLTLRIDGPFAAGLVVDDSNLVLRAARSFGVTRGAALRLIKNLPVASGIGGGSADAAATLRALSQMWGLPLPDHAAQLALGADVPVCMTSDLTLMRGIGDDITRLGLAPDLHIILVNPNVGVSTPVVFQGLAQKDNPPMSAPMPNPSDHTAWLAWLNAQRNDLEGPARQAAPVIGVVLDALAGQAACQIARMSGSGATCFGVFETAQACADACAALHIAHPHWWVVQTRSAT